MRRPRRKPIAASPTSRSLKLLRDRGYVAAVVEQTVPKTFIKRDLFGLWDILAVHPDTGEVLAVQTTSASHVSHRLRKIEDHEHLPLVRSAGWTLHVHGWRKVKNRWKCREVDVS